MSHTALIALRQALCWLLSMTDHNASRDLACLGICLADIHLVGQRMNPGTCREAIIRYDESRQTAEALWQRERAVKVPIEGSA
jgi:hypothetical protein